MTLRVVALSDDDMDIAGNLLADADFWDGDDGEVDAVDGVDPILRDLICWENSSTADATNCRTRCTLQLNTWPNTRRITHWGDRSGGIKHTEAAADPGGVGRDLLRLIGRYRIPLEAGDDWLSDASYMYTSVDNASVGGIAFCYSYGQEYPYKGGHMQWIRKVADAAEGAADAVYQAWAADLTGVAPGLDPHKNYVLRGIAHEAAATAKAPIGVWAAPQASAYKLFGPSWLDFGICVTMFEWDGIPCSGSDGFVAKTASSTAADTPYTWLGFEEYGEGAPRARVGGKLGRPAPAGGTLEKLASGFMKL